jgi:hypothetical protein
MDSALNPHKGKSEHVLLSFSSPWKVAAGGAAARHGRSTPTWLAGSVLHIDFIVQDVFRRRAAWPQLFEMRAQVCEQVPPLFLAAAARHCPCAMK